MCIRDRVYADHAENIAVIGQGTLNGNGQRWWKELREHKLAYVRPYMINFQYCKNIKIEDVTITMSPVSYTHLDVYKRQHHIDGTQNTHSEPS